MASDPPKVFISYSHDSPEHAQHVLEAGRATAQGTALTPRSTNTLLGLRWKPGRVGC